MATPGLASSPRPAGATPRARPWRSVARWIVAAAALLGAVGCEDANRMFTGVWQTDDPVEASYVAPHAKFIIGHFGPEATGVARFLGADGFTPDASCPCTFIEHVRLDLGRETLTVATTCDGRVVLWDLAREFDSDADAMVLVGSARPADTADATFGAPVKLRLLDDFIRPEDKACP